MGTQLEVVGEFASLTGPLPEGSGWVLLVSWAWSQACRARPFAMGRSLGHRRLVFAGGLWPQKGKLLSVYAH